MNLNQNQHIFEEFQRSVDQARILAQKLGPEHFYLAYDRCAKLQKVIFKRACGYCFLSQDTVDGKDQINYENKVEESINPATVPTNISYVNLPSFSLCGANFPLLISGQSVISSQLDFGMQKLIMLKQYTETVPSKEEEAMLDREGCVIKHPRLSNNECLKELLQKLLKYFPSTEEMQYELCLPQKANPVLLEPVIEEDIQNNQIDFLNDLCFFLRPTQSSDNSMKVEQPMSPQTISNSENSVNSNRINCFMVDADKSPTSDESIEDPCEMSVFPETVFPPEPEPLRNMSITLTDECKSRSTRRYNWSVVLSNLHEHHPTQLRNESVRFPDVCHELHAIPPTPQKLRPTKRCQLCLKGYKSRKESRYYCRPCDKGFHIKCFEVYHQQLGYVQYKVKIISGER